MVEMRLDGLANEVLKTLTLSLSLSLSLSRVCVCVVCVCVHIHSYPRNNPQMAWVIILDKIMQLIQKGK